MAEKIMRNVKLVAEERCDREWFDIYIDFSGNREYLMPHRQNEKLFRLLRNGVCIGELERSTSKLVSDVSLSGRRYMRGGINPRLKCRKNQARKLENSIGHLVLVANDYMEQMLDAA